MVTKTEAELNTWVQLVSDEVSLERSEGAETGKRLVNIIFPTSPRWARGLSFFKFSYVCSIPLWNATEGWVRSHYPWNRFIYKEDLPLRLFTCSCLVVMKAARLFLLGSKPWHRMLRMSGNLNPQCCCSWTQKWAKETDTGPPGHLLMVGWGGWEGACWYSTAQSFEK